MKVALVNYSIVVALTLISISDIAARIWATEYEGSAIVSTVVGGLIYALRGKGSD